MNYTCNSLPDKTWKDRLRDRLFPYVHCDNPPAPPYWKEVIVTKSSSRLSLADRLRVLVTGKVEVETRIVCPNQILEHKTNSVLRAGRFSR
jgi:hypothetical protein